ncbi:response regulator [Desulfatitalea alkaliphila]|uniref:Response regulator n=1 Tax=Desulfatitalea alkaliphila TaxID=2929485 RepID=A0AA41R7M2_9BACT|nr:response regulator [Desulfatitalea alkaliphila]MCJ8502600.1 response regulator [Desulfatitalea alkaliphila]
MPPVVLFVDAEKFVHKALRRSLRNLQPDWTLRFATDPPAALAVMAREPVDVLVSELVFPGYDGVDFLRTVRERHPAAVRILLSGYADRNILVQSVDLAHQFLAKPWEDATLAATIDRAFLVKRLLDHRPLKELIGRIGALPSLPARHLSLMAALRDPEVTFEAVGEQVAADLGLATRLLKLVNSSYFGLAQQVSSPAKAVSLLGLDLVQAIVLAAGTFDQFTALQRRGLAIAPMWAHAGRTAALARIIAQAAGLDRAGLEAAFMAGMLHDVGKLPLAAHLPAEFEAVTRYMQVHGCDMATAENQLLGTTHAAVGAYLFGLWGLPDIIIAAAAFHHQIALRSGQTFDGVLIVHVANAFAHAGPLLSDLARPVPGLDDAYLARIGMASRIAQWRTLCARRTSPLEK